VRPRETQKSGFSNSVPCALICAAPSSRVNGNFNYLLAREFQLLRYSIEHRDVTLSRDEILKEVWNYDAKTFTRTVDVHIASLRQEARGGSQTSSLNSDRIVSQAKLSANNPDATLQ
jgi:DNA-binding response OmpR family regulator